MDCTKHFTLFHSVSLLLLLAPAVLSQINIVTVIDASLQEGAGWVQQSVSNAQKKTGLSLKQSLVSLSLEDEEASEGQFCSALYNGAAVVLDLAAGGWMYGRDHAAAHGVPYVRVQISNYQWMSAVDAFLQSRNATDAALIFGSEDQLDQALYYLVEGSVIRVIVLHGIETNSTETLRKMRPAPSYYVIIGTTSELNILFNKALNNQLVSRDSRWTLVATDVKPGVLDLSLVTGTTAVTVIAPTEKVCCTVRDVPLDCACSTLNIAKQLVEVSMTRLAQALKASGAKDISGTCNQAPSTPPATDAFYSALRQEVSSWSNVEWSSEKKQVVPQMEFSLTAVNSSSKTVIGSWNTLSKLDLNPDYKNSPIRRFFKIGAVLAHPWLYQKEGGKPDEYEGYCMSLTKRLADGMEFDFKFVLPEDGQYGARQKNGSWNGLVGDLAKGLTDIIVAPLTMTSEREEVIDFVAPYFDQSGISIVIRKSQREESLFKFMTVLKAEVWVSIVAALVVTGVMIWLLDRYSPYSAQNNAALYPANCRKFTLKESFWFALTSFTPQGGGEAPKALSGRTLVAAYWLFVVLMLATFTANLAAFLTVERMQTPVSSLQELAGQSKINYTVLQSTSTEQYFTNMAAAEEELYRVWKELTLNSTSDQSKYRVWDYPIKEQYTHILKVIDETGPVATAEDGFKKVLDNEKGQFAFIHDASEIRYKVYHSCLLTEVGEAFAEQPYAIAVQQGSHLQDEISRAILELQKERYFEVLSAEFWNASARSACPNENDSEGITLQSLGGVFIATLIGLALAMIALAIEVLYYKRGQPKVNSGNPKLSLKMSGEKRGVIDVVPVYH
ncbi:ionotropic receptor 25a-like isoform X1 [Macrobrachium rosenbergii]|uniref:ionotropic receptor 25a-like isoform X1 n=1 Tax=Macrobrachium rosenbergii TaxID=79674 RepID=UPI0034D45D15